jgi:hypothetical protein
MAVPCKGGGALFERVQRQDFASAASFSMTKPRLLDCSAKIGFNLLTHLFGTVGIDTPARPDAMEP